MSQPAIASERAAPAFLEQGARWFLISGIQDASGGVARYHHTEHGGNARVSTEITGYAVSAFLDLHERTGEAGLFDAALRAGRFLCDTAWDRALSAMPFEWDANGALPERHTYFFDNGIVARGLLRLWRATGEQSFLDVAHACGESMRRDFVNDGDIHPILELPSLRPVPRDARWSRASDCYQLKSAMAWLELAAATGDHTFESEYDKALERALRTHSAFLAGEPGHRVMDRLHAYAYFLEGLLPRAARSEVRQALANGLERAGSELRRLRAGFERSDAGAQLLRLRLWAAQLGAVSLDQARAAEEAAFAAAYQLSGPDQNIDGGFCFGRRDGVLMPFVNPVSTAFCLQALALWDDRCHGRALAGWSTLI